MIRYRTTWEIVCQIVMVGSIFLASCKRSAVEPDNLSAYYIPFQTFPPNGKVYIYRNLADPEAEPEVWRHLRKSDHVLESINYAFYDTSNDIKVQEVVQRQVDRIITNGVVTDSLILVFKDSTGKPVENPVKVISGHRFPFQPGDSTQAWLTNLEWYQPEDSLHVVLQRRRRFIGHTSWTNDGKTYAAVKFRTEDTFETERDGWTTSSWTGEEIYARNIGLVYYKRHISDQLILEFELDRRK